MQVILYIVFIDIPWFPSVVTITSGHKILFTAWMGCSHIRLHLFLHFLCYKQFAILIVFHTFIFLFTPCNSIYYIIIPGWVLQLSFVATQSSSVPTPSGSVEDVMYESMILRLQMKFKRFISHEQFFLSYKVSETAHNVKLRHNNFGTLSGQMPDYKYTNLSILFDIRCHDHTFAKLAYHQIRHQATHKDGYQPDDCIWSLYSSSRVCMG